MKSLRKILLIACLLITGILFIPLKGNSDNKDQCVECHTSAKKLIQITREIAKTKPPAKSAEQEGVG
ncbi:MAG: hypothetical protein JW864_05370 [Spirochaetes bacterium]|nr:hypothetical protein [Spirochaetota bacterium]